MGEESSRLAARWSSKQSSIPREVDKGGQGVYTYAHLFTCIAPAIGTQTNKYLCKIGIEAGKYLLISLVFFLNNYN